MSVWLANLSEMTEQGRFYYGMLLGYSAAVLLFALLALLRWWRRRRSRMTTVRVAAPHGELLVQPRAIRDLVQVSLEDLTDLTIRRVDVFPIPNGYRVAIEIEVAPQLSLRAENQSMQERVISQLRDQVGVEGDLRVDFTVVGYAGKSA
jgi:hypothetical protein